jgi:hypothetical protein
LEPISGSFEGPFGFDYRDGQAGSRLENVVGTKGTIPLVAAAGPDDPSIGDPILFDDLVRRPLSRLQAWDYIVPAGL